MNTATTTTFKSYKVTTKKGNLMLVVNEGTSKTGERLLKVRPMRLIGYYSPSMYVSADYSYGDPIWIKGSAVA